MWQSLPEFGTGVIYAVLIAAAYTFAVALAAGRGHPRLLKSARLGAYARLIGTDTDPRAIAAATQNLERAGVEAALHAADATRFVPSARPTTIITNPPMGRRVHRGDAVRVLGDFIAHLDRVAAPDATLVWLNPSPAQTGPELEARGFRLVTSHRIDMGGFDVSLERRRRERSGK